MQSTDHDGRNRDPAPYLELEKNNNRGRMGRGRKSAKGSGSSWAQRPRELLQTDQYFEGDILPT